MAGAAKEAVLQTWPRSTKCLQSEQDRGARAGQARLAMLVLHPHKPTLTGPRVKQTLNPLPQHVCSLRRGLVTAQ